jgi:hypothetical protein
LDLRFGWTPRSTPTESPQQHTDRLILPVSCDLSDEPFADVDEHFKPTQRNELVYFIVLINAWNRLMLTNHNEAGKYEPPADLYQTASTTF